MSEIQGSSLLFCPACGNLLDLPGSEDFVTCNLCNHSQPCSVFEKLHVVTHSRPNAFERKKFLASADNNDEDGVSGAIIDEKCSKCGHHQMRFFTMQLRSADEGQTVFYTCIKCNFTYSLNS